ncbi:MAG: two-component system response regulator [Deinococcales bacterium]
MQLSSHLPTATPTRAPTVVFIDDDSSVRESLGALMTQRGYQVEYASSGVGGISLAWCLDVCPLAVVIDVMLPDMDGFEVASRLYNSPKTKGVNCILITTPNGLKDRRKSRRNLNFLTKPYRPSQLLEMFERLLEGK